MIKKTITYEDYNGNKRTEDFYFNMTKSELVDVKTKLGEDANELQFMQAGRDEGKAYGVFRDFILKAYGVKSDDGKRFIKNDEIRESLLESPALDVLLEEILSTNEAAKEFVAGVVPVSLKEKLSEIA